MKVERIRIIEYKNGKYRVVEIGRESRKILRLIHTFDKRATRKEVEAYLEGYENPQLYR